MLVSVLLSLCHLYTWIVNHHLYNVLSVHLHNYLTGYLITAFPLLCLCFRCVGHERETVSQGD